MRLQEYRKKAGIDQKDLADELGIAVQTVSSWETGARRPNIDMLIRLTEVFNCTADELLGIDRKRPDPEDETPRTREQEISVRMSEALADARTRQEA